MMWFLFSTFLRLHRYTMVIQNNASILLYLRVRFDRLFFDFSMSVLVRYEKLPKNRLKNREIYGVRIFLKNRIWFT